MSEFAAIVDISIQLILNSPEPYCKYFVWKISTDGIFGDGSFAK